MKWVAAIIVAILLAGCGHHHARKVGIVPGGCCQPTNVPVSTGAPTISGTTQQGQTLTEAHGTWTNTPTSYTFQWEDCDTSGNSCSNIAAATSQTYVLQAGDVGHTIRVAETATNASGSSSPIASNQTATVTAAIAGPSCSPNPCNGSAGYGSAKTVTVSDGLDACTLPCTNQVTVSYYEATPSNLNLTDATHPVPLVFLFSSGSINAPEATAWAQENGSASGGTCTGTCLGPYAVVQMLGPYTVGSATNQFGTPAEVWNTATGPQGSNPQGTNSCGGTPPAGFGSTAPCDITPAVQAILTAVECHTGSSPCLNVDTSKVYFTGGSKGGGATEDMMCDERTSSLGAAYGIESNSLVGPPPVSGTASGTASVPNCPALNQQCLYAASCAGSTNTGVRALFIGGNYDTYSNKNTGANISPNTSACNQTGAISGSVTGASGAAAKTAAAQNCLAEGFLQNSNTWWFGNEQLAGCTLGESGGGLLGGPGASSPCTATTGTFNGTSATTIGGAADVLGGFLGCPQAPSTITAFGANGTNNAAVGTTNAVSELIWRDHAPCSSGAELATIQVGDPSSNLAGAATYVGGDHLPQGVGLIDLPTEFYKFFTKQAMP